jgi:Raf kinase inhibitor-like YbhB/YbcL family protein
MEMIRRVITSIFLLSTFLAGCAPSTPQVNAGSFLILSSTSFHNGETIPAQFTCAGDNVSPALQWNDPPSGTQSFALIMDDPDAPAGVWVHWVIVDIPKEIRSFPQNLQPELQSIVVGENSWGKSAYGGPCPPSGVHHYVFKLYALDIVLPLDNDANKTLVLAAMDGHVLAYAELIGTVTK